MPTAKIFEAMERELASIGGEKDPPPRFGRAAEFFPPQPLSKDGGKDPPVPVLLY